MGGWVDEWMGGQWIVDGQVGRQVDHRQIDGQVDGHQCLSVHPSVCSSAHHLYGTENREQGQKVGEQMEWMDGQTGYLTGGEIRIVTGISVVPYVKMTKMKSKDNNISVFFGDKRMGDFI